MASYFVDPDLRRAQTLPGSFYSDPEAFAHLREAIFARSWQWLGHRSSFAERGHAWPVDLLPGLLDEPLVVTRDNGNALRAVSNVCTHRANVVVGEPGPHNALTCRYHGRKFDLCGRMLSMPEFEGVEGFPCAQDDLAALPVHTFAGQHFAALSEPCPFEEWVAPVRKRLGDLPIESFVHDPTRDIEYQLNAHWALYVDNFLEGFHIPYVHPALARTVDFDNYAIETYPWGSVQRARPRAGELAFDQTWSEHDEGKPAAAYFFLLYPNTMLNVYPWGISLNIVRPLGMDRTEVLFRSFVWKPELMDKGAGGSLDLVQREDESVVEASQRGTRARLYSRGRFSVRHEAAVHHFHLALSRALNDDLS